MPVETINTLVIGAGQAGIAMSEHLGRLRIPHLVLERERIAESWRTRRWDSLVANGPAWHDRFPNMEFPHTPGDGFPGKDEVAAYFEAYAAMVNAPVRCGTEVTALHPLRGRPGFSATTSRGPIEARNVVVATGAFQTPVIPPIVPQGGGLTQMHSSGYRHPAALPAGAVLVVGAGSSGVQIADELARAGRRVYLSVGPHDRPPRRYRGGDFVWWLGVLGKWEMQASAPGTEHVTIAVSGARGGETVDFRRLGREGIVLLGRTASCTDGVLHVAADLERNIRRGDASYLALLDEADAYIARNGLDLPEEPRARDLGDMPACVTRPVASLDLAAAGIGTIIWATGFSNDYGWMHVDAFDGAGRPKHQRGVCAEPGIYFLGLPWLSGRGSSFIWGVWHDARYVADRIAIRAGYHAHAPKRPPCLPPAACDPTPLESSSMAHTRIRPFNTRDTYPEQKLDNDLCQAVVARGTMVFLRGQCPQNLDDARNLGSHDPVEQTRKVMQNIRQLMQEAGGGMEHVCRLQVFLTDVRHREAVYRTMGEYIRGVHPVSTGLVVTALARPEWLVEIEATAVIPD